MNRIQTIAWGSFGLFAALVPALLYAHLEGPDPRHTAAPGDKPMACADADMCHTANPRKGGPINSFGGSVTATFSTGNVYIPGGAPITITVTIADPVNTHYGFQMSARLESDLANAQAGDFTTGSSHQLVLCDDGSVKFTSGCPDYAPVQFIEHMYPKNTSAGTTPYTFTWTPPASDSGPVHFYVAGNAVNNDHDQADGNDHVYTNSYVLTPYTPFACTNTKTPVITFLDSASGFGGYNYFSSGSWLEIKGTNLADPADPRSQWQSIDFNGVNAPTKLDGVSVSIGGKPAYVWYISSTQLNVQAPDDITTGDVSITVTNCSATSVPFTFAKQSLAPGLLAPDTFVVNGKRYLVATFLSDGAYVLNTGAISGVPSRPAKPGDTLIAYGVGFGDVTAADGSNIPAGVIATQSNTLANPFTLSFGKTAANLIYYGLAGNYVGLYEFFFTVPPGLADGDYQINVTLKGVSVPQTVYLTVHK